MGKEHASRHHRKAIEILKNHRIPLNEVRVDPRALRRFRDDRGLDKLKDKKPDKETQLRERLGESIEINPRSIKLVGGRSPSKRGAYFLDPHDQSVYFVKIGKKGWAVGDIYFPGRGKGEKQYGY